MTSRDWYNNKVNDLKILKIFQYIYNKDFRI